MEVQEHGLSVSRHQDIGWLDVEVDQTVFMGIVQAIRQLRPDRTDGLSVGSARQKMTRGRRRRQRGGAERPVPIELR